MVRSSVRVPQRQRMAWAVALAAGFVASTAVLTSTQAPVLAAGPLGDYAQGPVQATALPAGFSAPRRATPPSGPGITVLASPTSSGSLTVSETIRVATPIHSITLSPPQLPSGYDQAGVTVRDVVIVADGQTVVLDFTSLQGRRVVPLPTGGASVVTVSYVLGGTAKPGAANMVALQPIASVADAGILPVSYVVAAQASLSCYQVPTAAQGACSGTSSSTVTMLSGLASTQSALVINLDPTGGAGTATSGSGTVDASGPVGGSTPSGGSAATATAGSTAGSAPATTSTATADAPSTATSDPTSTATSTGSPATTAPVPTDTSTGTPTTSTPTGGATSTDPGTTPAPDPTTSDPSPVTLPTGTGTGGTGGTEGSTGVSTDPSTGTSTQTSGTSAQTTGGSASQVAQASAPATDTSSATASATAQQPVTGTGDPAPVVVTDPSSGPSTETVGAADPVASSTGSTSTEQAPAADPSPAPASDPTPAADPAPATDATSTAPAQSAS